MSGRPDSLIDLDRYLSSLAASDDFSGVVRISVADEARFAAAYGYASRAWKVPNGLDTRFDTASITKLFTAIATFQQIDAGRFALDTGVIGYLGLDGTSISPDVSVRQLLTHTSGIGDDADEEAGESYEAIWHDRPNYSVLETAEFLPQFVHRAPNFAPGEGCRYNNCGYVLLGLMIERATGRSYRDVVREEVFLPAEMTDSEFLRMDRVNERVAEGADPIPDSAGGVAWKRNIYSYPPIGSPDSGAYVTATDLDRFLRAVRTGRLMSESATAAFLTPQVVHERREDATEYFGFGPSFLVRDDGAVIFLEKDGVNAGVSGVVRYYPGRDLTVVMLSNLERGVWEPIRAVHRLVLTDAFD